MGQGYDIIGDCHGCYDELVLLLQKLGYGPDPAAPFIHMYSSPFWHHPEGRKLVFAGDLVDRGPASDKVLDLVMNLDSIGMASCVMGNHENKLMRYLLGNKVKVGHGLEQTIKQLNARGLKFQAKVLSYLRRMPLYLKFPTVIVVHGAYVEGASPKRFNDHCLYGVTTGIRDERGYLIRDNKWKGTYSGRRDIVVGHDPIVSGIPDVVTSSSGSTVTNVDTACVFGGYLTAIRYPEKEIYQVKAKEVYCEM